MNFLEITCFIHPTSDLRIGWKGPINPMPIPKTRAEMEQQLDSTWAEIRKAMLDGAFPLAPPQFSAGDDDSGES